MALNRYQTYQLLSQLFTHGLTEEDFEVVRQVDALAKHLPDPFDLDEAAIVRIAIFDRHGKMVLDVVKQQFDAGHNHVTFSPSSLPTGIYYLYVFSGGRVGMRKCMII